ncbi:hypothetical protein Ddc_23853 [Ditylenchus destructor]|nr:hypothetical protein Ddc_23853 [Ditylenchus destructor]
MAVLVRCHGNFRCVSDFIALFFRTKVNPKALDATTLADLRARDDPVLGRLGRADRSFRRTRLPRHAGLRRVGADHAAAGADRVGARRLEAAARPTRRHPGLDGGPAGRGRTDAAVPRGRVGSGLSDLPHRVAVAGRDHRAVLRPAARAHRQAGSGGHRAGADRAAALRLPARPAGAGPGPVVCPRARGHGRLGLAGLLPEDGQQRRQRREHLLLQGRQRRGLHPGRAVDDGLLPPDSLGLERPRPGRADPGAKRGGRADPGLRLPLRQGAGGGAAGQRRRAAADRAAVDGAERRLAQRHQAGRGRAGAAGRAAAGAAAGNPFAHLFRRARPGPGPRPARRRQGLTPGRAHPATRSTPSQAQEGHRLKLMLDLVRRHKLPALLGGSTAVGIPSMCSAHPVVLAATLRECAALGRPR